jgi:hypothetical protein
MFSAFEIIVDQKNVFIRRNVLISSLYINAPFPVQNSTNHGDVHVAAGGNMLTVQTSTFDHIEVYTLCGFDEQPSTSTVGVCVPL